MGPGATLTQATVVGFQVPGLRQVIGGRGPGLCSDSELLQSLPGLGKFAGQPAEAARLRTARPQC